MNAFVAFMKVVGNESYITTDKQAISNFKVFVRQVVHVAITSPKARPLLKIIFDDVVTSYRQKLKELVKKPVHIQKHFMMESEAAKLMNPFILLKVVKAVLREKDGFEALCEIGICSIINVLCVVNAAFLGNYQLKDKFWGVLIQLLARCEQLPSEELVKIVQLSIFQELLQPLEAAVFGRQCPEDHDEVKQVISRF